ncbi:hypothetical protein [Tsukamurella pseudospumae]|uniref:Uncharacterized protein n=1 Tax=Tsukamurella pseudospumae TaxID=239498 RepID=A0A137ZTS7_9ACTN|nr:hypothetical protein [Tsukamurella pseudospumae]KXP01594.1 hypothetical protein AXK61_01995 [Tsukamurella pseudospumae]
MDEVVGRLSEAAHGAGFDVAELDDGSISVVSSAGDAGVVVVPDRGRRTYRLEAPLPMTADSGVVHESWSQVGPGPQVAAGGFVGKRWTGGVSLTYDPRTRQWLADPSGRIDGFVRGALEPHGWERRWTRTNRWTLAAVVGVVLLCIALWAGVTAAFAVALRSTLAPGWVCLISLALLGYGLFMFWWGRIRTR